MASVTKETWLTLFDVDGRVVDAPKLRKIVFEGVYVRALRPLIGMESQEFDLDMKPCLCRHYAPIIIGYVSPSLTCVCVCVCVCTLLDMCRRDFRGNTARDVAIFTWFLPVSFNRQVVAPPSCLVDPFFLIIVSYYCMGHVFRCKHVGCVWAGPGLGLLCVFVFAFSCPDPTCAQRWPACIAIYTRKHTQARIGVHYVP